MVNYVTPASEWEGFRIWNVFTEENTIILVIMKAIVHYFSTLFWILAQNCWHPPFVRVHDFGSFATRSWNKLWKCSVHTLQELSSQRIKNKIVKLNSEVHSSAAIVLVNRRPQCRGSAQQHQTTEAFTKGHSARRSYRNIRDTNGLFPILVSSTLHIIKSVRPDRIWGPCSPFPGIKRQGREADYSRKEQL
jgi:hypothetical protein